MKRITRSLPWCRGVLPWVVLLAWPMLPLAAGGDAEPKPAAGQRVFSAGHSFHMFVPKLLAEMADAAAIADHVQAGMQSIGGSRVIQHWELPADRNTVRPALESGEVDVLTLSPIYLPDEGIELLARLAVEHNPQVHVTLQEFWLPFDVYQTDYKQRRPEAPDRDSRTAEELHSLHAPYFESIDQHVRQLNRALDREVLYVVPAGQAVIALREKIISGVAPGLERQSDLFRDPIGHGTPALQALVAYCHFAVIYRRSPVGLPVPSILESNFPADTAGALNQLLQELAWQAAVEHPLSGVAPSRP